MEKGSQEQKKLLRTFLSVAERGQENQKWGLIPVSRKNESNKEMKKRKDESRTVLESFFFHACKQGGKEQNENHSMLGTGK